MQIFTLTRATAAIAAIFLFSFALSAQENKKEVHIKIVENGVVTKDTVYNVTGDVPEIENFTQMETEHSEKHPRHMKERQVIIMDDSTMENMDWVQEDGKHKEVRVIVTGGDGKDEVADSNVEEIWLQGPGDGRPCHTIIIHEGDCPGQQGMEHMMPPKPPMHDCDKNENVEKKIIKTEGGDKVIVVETKDDVQKPKEKGKKH